jgi:dTDP-3-amino-3,4,6-trideoxy-alpha-D-glucose transaminase
MRHAIGVASGLDALEISLRLLGCGPGDLVLTTPLSAFATTLSILKLGAVPVFVDTDDRGLIDLARCRTRLSRRPFIEYFIPVHLYGQALDMPELRRLRDDFDLRMVEDCAQSIGTRTGTVGQLAATSFYPTKNLGAMGDGGAILTNDAALDEQARVLRSRHESSVRLDELQAAILRTAILPRLDKWLARRREIAHAYQKGQAKACPTVGQASACPLQNSSWHLYPIQVPPAARPALLNHLKSAGIAPGIHYPTLSLPPSNRAATARERYPHAHRISNSEVSLPIHPYLTDHEVARVVQAVNTHLK